MDPNPLTMREVLNMAAGKEKATWSQTSHLMAIVHNVHVSREDQLDPADFNPYANTVREELEYWPSKETNDMLKKALRIE